MGVDTFMIFAGVCFGLFGLGAWVIYLMRPKAILLDATSMAWVGFILWIGLGFIGVGQNMFRSWEDAVVATAASLAKFGLLNA